MRVVLQHPQRLFREGLTSLLGAADDLVVVGAVQKLEELLELCERSKPDVAVVDLDGVAPSPSRALGALQRRVPAVTVVGVHGTRSGIDAERLRRAGVATAIARTQGFEAVLHAVRHAHAGPPPEGATPLPLRRGPRLTARETTVLNLVAAGRTAREISRELRVSHKTVENHKQRTFAKLGVQNQAHAVSVAIGRGMIDPNPGPSVAARR